MHPMLQLTVRSGIIAIVLATSLPLVPRKLRKGMLAACLAVMFYLTLFRGSHDIRQINLFPFWSYREWRAADVRWQIYMNVFLFVPYGAILKSLGARHPIWIAMGTSALIELLQLLFRLGMCETDDVINNTLGAVAGCAIYMIVEMLVRRIKHPEQDDMSTVK